MSEHTPLPYRSLIDKNLIVGSNDHCVCETLGKNYKENTNFIIEACNSHAKLIAALKGAREIIDEYRSHGLAQGSEYVERIRAIEQALNESE